VSSSGVGSLRIGCVKYLNARPLIHSWPGEVAFDHPAALCRRLAAGDLDVAFVSSFEYLRNPIYKLVDDVAVAADGPVWSVFVAHREPLDEVRTITVDPASATSVNLLRVLLAERKLPARLVESGGESQLLIGDQAIAFRQQPENGCTFWDLGEEWKCLTSLPFVFALWLIRPEVENATAIAEALRQLRDANLARLDELAPDEFTRVYFDDHLRFRFGEREKAGLLMFRSLCEKHGILQPNSTRSFQLV
jgi:chorismate dehydratase